MSPLRRPHRFLRATLLVLLALGVVVNPLLGAVSELHGVEHAATADVVDDHGHGHAHPTGTDHRGGIPEPDADHSLGSHGLLHQGAGVTAALPEVLSVLPSDAPAQTRIAVPEPPHLPDDLASLPFRPPIA
ncbi:MAG: hypothetical protein EPO30_03735 [Lysobacteraceae bacterium]|nr:MAG: hypothetical protein EPO30_03735 [Xanthomonadaceae bacterium]